MSTDIVDGEIDMKTAATLMAALMALMAFAPVASADDDGNLSRTFLGNVYIDWKPHSTNPGDGIGGAGWYHPDSRDDLCFVRLFGVSDAGFYYQGIPKPRVTHNLFNVHLAHVSELTVSGDPCPFDSTLPAGNVIGTSAFNVWLSSGVDQSFLGCLKTFSLCNFLPLTAQWSLFYCNGWDGTGSETDPNKNKNRVIFQAGDIVGTYELLLPPVRELFPTLGSSGIWAGCTVGVDDGVFGYDVSSHLDDQLQRLSSLTAVHVDQFSPVGTHDWEPKPTRTSYWMSCFYVDYQVFPENVIRSSRTHDWFLVLDGDDPENWPGALVYHELAPEAEPKDKKKYPTSPNSVLEQGLFDLTGQNGCDNEPATLPLPDDKKPKDAPLVSL